MLFERVRRATLCEAPLRFCKSVFKMSHKLWFLRHRWWNPAKSRWGRDIPDISPLKVSSTQPRCHVVTYPFSGMIAAFATFQKKSYHPLWFGLCLTSRVLWWQQQKHARLKIYTHRNARSFWTLCSEICSCGKIEVTSHWRVWAQSCSNLRIFFCRLACAQSFAYVDVRVSQLSSWQPTTIVHARGLREGQCCYCPGLCWICWALLHQHVHLQKEISCLNLELESFHHVYSSIFESRHCICFFVPWCFSSAVGLEHRRELQFHHLERSWPHRLKAAFLQNGFFIGLSFVFNGFFHV